MGLKEGLSPTKKKMLMLSLITAEGLDVLTTGVGFHVSSVSANYRAAEVSPFGGQEVLNNFELNEAFILKLAVTALLIGTYALTSIHNLKKENKNKHLEIKSNFVFDTAFVGANMFAWGVVAWNAVQLAKI